MAKFSSVIRLLLFQLIAFLTQVKLQEHQDFTEDFTLFTVATNETDGFRRFIRSTEYYKIPTKVLGLNKKWEGGSMQKEGGGQKVNLLRKALKQYVDKPNAIIMFTDGYDVVVVSDVKTILAKFLSMDARIVFSAEPFCWPNELLASSYPTTESSYKFLNSGGYIGYAKDIFDLISSKPIKDRDDDQLYYTELFLNKTVREKYRIRLDTKTLIFQNLFGVEADLKLNVEAKNSFIENIVHGTVPSVIHGNGPAKLTLNTLGNYIAGAWSTELGCTACAEQTSHILETTYPTVVLGIFITHGTPFLEEFFEKLQNLDYPKNKLYLFVYNNVAYHKKLVDQFIEKEGQEYKSIKVIQPLDQIPEKVARDLALEHCLSKSCGYFFSVDSVAHLDNSQVLRLLIQDNKEVVAPLLVRPHKAWSNFWGALNKDGFYARSLDYMDIVNHERRGIWNVPYITNCYLINATAIPNIKNAYSNDTLLDGDMAFCKQLRNLGIFMFVDNLVDMGHLVDAEDYNHDNINPEFYTLFSNQWDWEQRYIHPDYPENFKPGFVHKQPCPDVYWFPIVSPKFCKELIEIMENFGQWSSGSNYDERLQGGYENVPTRDIHMNQVGFEPQWLHFLKLYVRPLQELVFTGYYHDPPKSLMNFVVRYRPDEQPFLRPHHDSSTYTINIALNTPNVDYEGGGCKFIRYNCSVTNTKLGWVLMHPGRLTHYHEGLKVTSGTRYIMISFVDP